MGIVYGAGRIHAAFLSKRHIRCRFGLHVLDLRLPMLSSNLTGLLLRLLLLLLMGLHLLEDLILIT